MFLKFIVPAEVARGTRESERRPAGRNFDHRRIYPRSYRLALRGWRNLCFERQLVQHIRQRLRVHQAMFNGYIEQRRCRKPIAC